MRGEMSEVQETFSQTTVSLLSWSFSRVSSSSRVLTMPEV